MIPLGTCCPESCPGCPYRELPYEQQLALKRAKVEALCRRYPELAELPVIPVAPADPVEGYRRRAKWVIAGRRLGLYQTGTHELVEVGDCRVLHPRLAEVTAAIRARLPWEPLRAVDLRLVDSGVLVTWVVTAPADDQALTELRETAREQATRLVEMCPSVCGVALGLRKPGAIQLLGKRLIPILGDMYPRCRLDADMPWYFAAPGAFTQSHAGQERALKLAILAAIAPIFEHRSAPEIVELFAGSGALSLALAARGGHVTAVESFVPAAELAARAAQAQQLPADLLAVDATRAVTELVELGRHADLVLVNPPRRGLPAELRSVLPRLEPRMMIYVSCDPATLARDLADLARRGWHCRGIQPFDMMPLTAQIECLAVLVPGSSPPPRVIYADGRLLAVDKAPHEPTTPQGEHATSLLERVRRLAGAQQAVPVHRLDLTTSGVCLFARYPAHVPELAGALAAGEKVYLGLARGIVRKQGCVSRSLAEQGRQLSASTRYSRMSVEGGHSLLSVRPATGRRHQIRRHLAAIGHAILGDERYGDRASNRHFWMRHGLDRSFLHCHRIRLALGGQTLEFSSPLPPDLVTVLERLAKGTEPDEE